MGALRQFRKKPVVINAVQNDGSKEAMAEILRLHSGIQTMSGREDGVYTLVIPTLEGRMIAHPYDWIIQGVHGEVYPCDDESFQSTYDPVDDNG